MYSFYDPDGSCYHVYKHHDGYPTGAAEALANALTLAWPLPRYEADEFAAAFVAANKDTRGEIRLMPSGDWKDIAPQNLEYRYVIAPKKEKNQLERILRMDQQIIVTCYSIHHIGFISTTVPKEEQGWKETKLFDAPLKPTAALMRKAEECEKDETP
jgi:hypothetical protein